jgi:hypothetical protein
MVRLSALRTGRLYPPGNIPGTHFCYRLSQPQGHSAAGRIMSMKNSSDTFGNRTRDLTACSAVRQPTALKGKFRDFPPERVADHSPTSGTVVKNEWIYSSTPTLQIFGVQRENVGE